MKVYRELEELMVLRAPELLQMLNGPASNEEIASLEDRAGTLPVEIKELLAWQNGDNGGMLLGEGLWSLMSSVRIERFLQNCLRSGMKTVQIDGNGIDVFGPRTRILPFASWNSQIFASVVVRSDGSTKVVGLDLVNEVASDWAASIEEFLEMVVDALKRDSEGLNIDSLPHQNVSQRN